VVEVLWMREDSRKEERVMQNLSDPRLINYHAIERKAREVKHPIAAPSREGEGFLWDPRTLLDTESIAFADLRVGMFVRRADWNRLRLVVLVEGEGDTRTITLADPSPRLNGRLLRRVTAEIAGGYEWAWAPGLSRVWEAAHKY
jgi:hypothetical protein